MHRRDGAALPAMLPARRTRAHQPCLRAVDGTVLLRAPAQHLHLLSLSLQLDDLIISQLIKK